MLARRAFVAVLATIGLAAPAAAQTTSDSCSKLQQQYDRDVKTANTIVMDLANKVLQGSQTPQIMSDLGLDPNAIKSAEEAVRKGVIAAMSPPAQNAILIYLLSANTAMQTIIWKGCKPPSR